MKTMAHGLAGCHNKTSKRTNIQGEKRMVAAKYRCLELNAIKTGSFLAGI